MPTSLFVVLSNPAAGREAEFKDWYCNVHLPDVVLIPGVESAQMFAAIHPWANAGHDHRYLALYGTSDSKLAIDSMRTAFNTPKMRMSRSIDLPATLPLMATQADPDAGFEALATPLGIALDFGNETKVALVEPIASGKPIVLTRDKHQMLPHARFVAGALYGAGGQARVPTPFPANEDTFTGIFSPISAFLRAPG